MKEEQKGLFLLRTRSDIVIKKADKGSATLIMSRGDDVREVKRHLQNTTNYQRLDEDPTRHYLREVHVKSFLHVMVD